VPFSVKNTGDDFPRTSPRHHVLIGLIPASMVCWLSHGHLCRLSGDATPMIPQSPFIEHGTDPGCVGEGCPLHLFHHSDPAYPAFPTGQ
jgi:hypothetical protein